MKEQFWSKNPNKLAQDSICRDELMRNWDLGCFGLHPLKQPQTVCPHQWLLVYPISHFTLEDSARICLKKVTKVIDNSQIPCCSIFTNLLFFHNLISTVSAVASSSHNPTLKRLVIDKVKFNKLLSMMSLILGLLLR